MKLFSIENAHKIARERGGECLSTEIAKPSNQTKLLWRCDKGHDWSARIDHVLRDGTWCPTCARIKRSDSIERMHKIAKERGGKCLSEVFVNHHTKLSWQCHEGHQWEAEPTTIVHQNSWCPYCLGKHQTIDDLRLLAIERGGKCLSTEYRSSNTKYEWKCGEGHCWLATANSIKGGHWCPKCADFHNGVRKRLKTLKKIYEIAKRKGGHCLSDTEDYDKAGARVKLECEHGPRWKASPKHIIGSKSWCPMCHTPKNKYTLEDIQGVARKRGGECLSKEYFAIEKPLLWRCGEGHEFTLTGNSVINGKSWCRECKCQAITLKDAINLAREKGGLCLSGRAKNTTSLLRWECAQGHQWRANYHNAKEAWCGECRSLIAKHILDEVA